MTYEHFRHWRNTPVSLEPFLSVVIPTFNEEERIVPTIASIAAKLTEDNMEFEIIVSDDGSTDDTVARVRSLELRNLVVLNPGFNRGKGAAVRDGINAASGAFILFTDADLSTPIEELDQLLNAVMDADVVIGSRAAPGGVESHRSDIRKLLSSGSRLLISAALGLSLNDTQCGFKLFRRDAARQLFGTQRIDGFGFDAELMYIAKQHEMRVTEVPVRWFDAPGSSVRPVRCAIRGLLEVGTIRLNSLLGRYRRPATPANSDAHQGLKLGVVTALPPSSVTLCEYGHHLVLHLIADARVDELIVFAEDGGDPPTVPNGVTVIPAWTFNRIGNIARIARAVRSERPDAVLFNMHFTSFGGRKVAAALGLLTPALVRLTRTPTIVLLHNLVETTDLEAAGYSNRRLERGILEFLGRCLTRAILAANVVVTTMPNYVEILRDKYGARNVSLTPHGSFTTPALPDESGYKANHILAFGKFGTYKRVEELLDAVRILKKDHRFSDIKLTIAGTNSPMTPGYLESMQESAQDISGVHFTGYVEEDDVAPLFRAADVVAFPYTATTGSSGPLHQAGSHARAVVAPQLGDFVSLVAEEGFIVEPFRPGDPASLAAAIGHLLSDDELRRRHEIQNHAAATGLPIADIAAWHVEHIQQVLLAS